MLTAWNGPGLKTTFLADRVVPSSLVAMELRGPLFTTVPFSVVSSAFSFGCDSGPVMVCVSASFWAVDDGRDV